MKSAPPYPPYALFIRVITELAEIGIPRKIRTSTFPELPDGARSSLLGALQYLGLIEEDGIPTPRLPEFAKAGELDRPKVWKPIIRAAYSFVFNDDRFELSQATAEDLAERFRNEHVSGGTLNKAVAFFIALTTDAGIPISPSLMRRKHPASRIAVGPRRPPAPEGSDRRTTNSAPEAAPGDPAAIKEKSLADILYDLLDPNRMSDEEQKAVLTLLLYLKKQAVEVVTV
jgi:hypothetical protein